MIEYVVGFAFSQDKERVVLIKKNRGPAELVGKLNGLGGKKEPGETDHDAMRREFLEETGVDVRSWSYQGRFQGEGWSVKVYRVFTDAIRNVRTMESEEVRHCEIAQLSAYQMYGELCPHVQTLVGLCLNDKIKKFSFEE